MDCLLYDVLSPQGNIESILEVDIEACGRLSFLQEVLENISDYVNSSQN